MGVRSALSIRVLGPIEVAGGDGPVPLGGPQQRKVLAVLLADPGRVLTYDRLLEVLWPDQDEPTNARRSAISYVSRLRSAVGDGVIATTDAGYVIDPRSIDVDADRFVELIDLARTLPAERAAEMLDDALALWRGQVFGDLNGAWWARPMVDRLDELRLTAMAERLDALVVNGWTGPAVAEATSLVDAHPLREQLVERAMRGLHAIGQTLDASRTFQRYREALADSGLVPSDRLVELERSLISGTPVEPPGGDPLRRLRGYVFHEPLGHGRAGTTYRATQPGVEREVAVKVIRPELADDREFIRRFESEAQQVARLEHPHIVPLYDFWRQPGGAFLVFRLMRGGSLADRMARRGPMSIAEAGELLEQIGVALHTAHRAGIVHGDVEPANVLFDVDGRAYLADFSIAASLDERSDTSGDEPPSRHVDTRSDDELDGALDDQRDLARTMNDLLLDVPQSVADVLTIAMAAQRDRRFASVADFVAAWRRALVGGDDGHDRRADPTVVTTRHTNPYKGLRAFREGDSNEFHGRSDLIDRLHAAIDAEPFLLLVGPSGSGKSSLVFAGLVPRLRATGALVAVMSPGERPLDTLADALSHVASEHQADLLTAASMRRTSGAREALAAVAGLDPLYLVIDQLEELWTLSGDGERARFLTEVTTAVAAGHVRVISTIRADFFDRPLADPMLGPLTSKRAFGITPMTGAELHAAITAPAAEVGVGFEPMLVSRLVAEASHQAGSLPLLQFVLAELFHARRGNTITLADYDEFGGLAGSLGRHAESIYETLPADDRRAVRRMFSRMVVPGDQGEQTRRRVPVCDLAAVPPHVIDAFVRGRLVTSDRDRTSGEPTIEVAHEVLLSAWPRLQGWLAEDRALWGELGALAAAAAAWEASGREPSELYRGPRLALVGELVESHADALTAAERSFVEASREHAARLDREVAARLAAQRRQNRRLRRSLAGLVAVLAVAVAASVVAVVQRRRADDQQRVAVEQRTEAQRQSDEAEAQRAAAEDQRARAEAEQAKAVSAAAAAQTAGTTSRLTTLASQSLALRPSQRDLAALLAVEAWRRAPDATSRSALFGTFTFEPSFFGYLRRDRAASVTGAVVPGTPLALVGGYAETDQLAHDPVEVIDVTDGTLVRQLDPLDGGPFTRLDIAVGSNGRFAAVVGSPAETTMGTLGVFDVATGHQIGVDVAVPSGWPQVAVDDTGGLVAVASKATGEVVVYRSSDGAEVGRVTATGPPIAPAAGVDGFSGAVAFAPDGELWVGSATDHLRAVDPATMRITRDIAVPRASTATLLRFGADGSTLMVQGIVSDGASGTQIGALARIDLTSGTVVWQVTGQDYGYGECASLAFSEASNQLWCGDYFGVIRERSLATGERTGTTLENQKGWVGRLDLALTDRGAMLVAFGGNSGTLGRWGVDGSGPIQRATAPDHSLISVVGNGDVVLIGAPSPRPFPLNLDYTLWDTRADVEIDGLPSFIYARAIGGVVYGYLDDGSVGAYDVRTGGRTSYASPFEQPPTTATLSRDGTTVLVGYADGTAAIHDAATGALMQRFAAPATATPRAVYQVVMTADHARVYVAGGGIRLFDAHTGRLVATNDDASLTSLALSSTGELAAGRSDGTLGLFDADTLEQIDDLPGARGLMGHLAFSDDGAILLGAANDSSVSIYDVSGRRRLGDAIRLQSPIGRLTDLSVDGGTLAVPGPTGDGVVLWDLSTRAWVAAACSVAGRNLTAAEWNTYIGDLGPYRDTCAGYPSGE